MGLVTKRVTCTTGAGGTAILAADSRRSRVMVRNIDATNVVWIGPDSTVTAGTAPTTDGYRLSPGQEMILERNQGSGEALQGIASVANVDVSVLTAT